MHFLKLRKFVEDNIDTFTQGSSSVKNWDFEGMNNEFLESLSIDMSSEIKNINEDNFVEEKIDNIKPSFFKNIHGTHHMSYNEDYCVIDFVRRS